MTNEITYKLIFYIDGLIVDSMCAARKAAMGNDVPCVFQKGNSDARIRIPESLKSDGKKVWLRGNSDFTVDILTDKVRANINPKKLKRKKTLGTYRAIGHLMHQYNKDVVGE